MCCVAAYLFTQQDPAPTEPLLRFPEAQDLSGLFQFLQVLSPCWAMSYLRGGKELEGLVYSGSSSLLVPTCLHRLTLGPTLLTLVFSLSRQRNSMRSCSD